jgi:hypothetical protein
MPRSVYRWNTETKQLEDITDRPPDPDQSSRYISDAYLDNERTTDGIDISSRTKRNAYLRSTGLTMANDYSEGYRKERKDSDSRADRRALREDVGRVRHELQKQGRWKR